MPILAVILSIIAFIVWVGGVGLIWGVIAGGEYQQRMERARQILGQSSQETTTKKEDVG